MKNFEVGFTYMIEEYGLVVFNADNDNEADEIAREHVRETYPDATNVTIDYVKEITING